MPATYDLDAFIAACNEDSQVQVSYDAGKDAQSQFGLSTKKALLDFIGHGGLEDRHFVNTRLWQNNPHPENPVMIDAYTFSSGRKRGYLAFRRTLPPASSKWLIKSFHVEDASGYFPFEGLRQIVNIKPLPCAGVKGTEPEPEQEK